MTEQTKSTRGGWFDAARFGMFVHWGVYSLLERQEWVMYQERIPYREYAPLAQRFNPDKFDADGWAALAAHLLAGGHSLRLEQRGDRLFIRGLPAQAPDQYDSVIRLELEGLPAPAERGIL